MKSYMVIQVMNALYDNLVLHKEEFDVNEGMAFSITISSECLGFEEDGMTRHEEWRGHSMRQVYVIMLQNHQVFVHVSRSNSCLNELPQTGWKNTSNHDSCWRSGCDIITDLGFKCWDEAFANCPEEHRRYSKDCDTRFDMNFGLLGPIFKTVRVEKKSCSDGYHYEITKVEEIKSRLVKAC